MVGKNRDPSLIERDNDDDELPGDTDIIGAGAHGAIIDTNCRPVLTVPTIDDDCVDE